MDNSQYKPTSFSPPGATLQDILKERGITRKQMSSKLGCTPEELDQIIKGEAHITTKLALDLERVLGTLAKFWHNREARYREYLNKVCYIGFVEHNVYLDADLGYYFADTSENQVLLTQFEALLETYDVLTGSSPLYSIEGLIEPYSLNKLNTLEREAKNIYAKRVTIVPSPTKMLKLLIQINDINDLPYNNSFKVDGTTYALNLPL